MFANNLYLIAAIAVLCSCFGRLPPWMAVVPLGLVLAVALVQRGVIRWSSWGFLLPAAALLWLVALAFLPAVDLHPSQVAWLCSGIALAFLLVGPVRRLVLVLLTGGGLILLLCAYYLAPTPEAILGVVALTGWLLAAWPLISLQISEGDWPIVLPVGLLGLGGLVVRVLSDAQATTRDLSAIFSSIWTYGDSAWALAQTLLVVLSVSPLLMHSSRRWRGVTGLGLLIGLGPLLATMLTGPWVDGYPLIVWIGGIPGLLLIVAGVIGMLCTVQRGELLGRAAYRAVALGIGASAVLIASLDPTTLPGRSLILTIAAALAPLAWALVLALLLGIASSIAARREAVRLSTGRVAGRGVRLPTEVRISFQRFGRRIRRTVTTDAHTWLHPQGLVPALLLILLALRLPRETVIWGLAALVVLAIPARSLAQIAVSGWVLLYAAGLAVAGWLLGAETDILLGIAALGLPLAWPFVHWWQLNPGWALPAGLWLLAAAWPLFGIGPEHQILVVLGAGLGCLVGNLLLPGHGRMLILSIGAAWVLAVFSWWVPVQDRFATVQFERLSLLGEVLELIRRFPFIALGLLGVWLGRAHFRQQGRVWQPAFVFSRMLPAIAGLSCWLIGYDDAWWAWVPAWIMLLSLTPRAVHELADSQLGGETAPLLDSVALALVVLLIGLGDALTIAQSHGEALLPAGSLGTVLVTTLRDLLAVVATSLAVLLVRRLVAAQERIARALSQAIERTIRMTARRPRQSRTGTGSTPIAADPAWLRLLPARWRHHFRRSPATPPTDAR